MQADSHETHDLSKLERRLSNWTPSSDGLNPDAMLYEAGRASARPGLTRLLWPALACGTTALAIWLGVWLHSERSERIALAEKVQKLSRIVVPESSFPAMTPTDSSIPDDDSSSSYLATHRVLESGVENWPDRTVAQAEKPDPISLNTPILRAGRPDVLLDP